MQLTDRHRKLLRWVGYPLLALLTFIFAVFYTFPYERLKGKIVESLSAKYDVSIASIEPTLLPGGMVLETVMIKTRPETDDEKPVALVFQEIEVDVGLLSALTGDLDVDFLASIAGGKIEGAIEYDSGGVSAEIETEMLPLTNIPGVAQAVGLPITGALNADIALELPEMKWSEADGHIDINCIGCTVGDGKAKLSMKPPPGRRSRRAMIYAQEGVTVPRINLGAAVAKIDIEDGVGKIETFTATSKDGFLKIDGEIGFEDPFKNSTFPACITFKFSEELKKREEKMIAIEATIAPKARQPDGSFAMPTKGKLASFRLDPRRECDGSSPARGDDDDSSPTRRRPTITAAPPRTERTERTDGDDERPPPIPPPTGSDDDEEDEPAAAAAAARETEAREAEEGEGERESEEQRDPARDDVEEEIVESEDEAPVEGEEMDGEELPPEGELPAEGELEEEPLPEDDRIR